MTITTKILGLVAMFVITYIAVRPRRKTSMDAVHDGHGEHVKDVSPHAGHGGKVDRGSKKTGGGCCG
jgi:hypothetical protein